MPRNILYFERLFLASLALGLVMSALTIKDLGVQSGEAFKEFGSYGAILFVVTIQLLTLAVMLVLVLLISRKRSKIAKWILVVLFIIGMFFYIPTLADMLSAGLTGVISTLQLMMQLAGLYFLFTPNKPA